MAEPLNLATDSFFRICRLKDCVTVPRLCPLGLGSRGLGSTIMPPVLNKGIPRICILADSKNKFVYRSLFIRPYIVPRVLYKLTAKKNIFFFATPSQTPSPSTICPKDSQELVRVIGPWVFGLKEISRFSLELPSI